jgi:hypothetical protein
VAPRAAPLQNLGLSRTRTGGGSSLNSRSSCEGMNDSVLERRERQGCVLDEFQGCHIKLVVMFLQSQGNIFADQEKWVRRPNAVHGPYVEPALAWATNTLQVCPCLSVCLPRVSHGVGNLQDRRPDCWNTGEQVIVGTHCSAILVQEWPKARQRPRIPTVKNGISLSKTQETSSVP